MHHKLSMLPVTHTVKSEVVTVITRHVYSEGHEVNASRIAGHLLPTKSHKILYIVNLLRDGRKSYDIIYIIPTLCILYVVLIIVM
jgi:hypothetical protein